MLQIQLEQQETKRLVFKNQTKMTKEKKAISVIEEKGQLFSYIRNKFVEKTPEELVRQTYVVKLVNEYGYTNEQMKEEENLTGRGSAQARGDIIIYKSKEDLASERNPLIIVECKAEYINISERDYLQGELYARMFNAPFFVTHNNKETRFWRVKKDKSPGYREPINDIPKAEDTEKEIKKLLTELRAFEEDDFRKILEQCHDIIYRNDKLDPTAAFDEIAKILFMKVYAERNLKAGKGANIFSLEWVEEAEKYTKDFISNTFEETKKEFGKGEIFKEDEKINLKKESVKQIIQKLQKYNLSATSADIKGIAFEKFLGNTFRSDNGMFFTPRTIVEFMIDMLSPEEGKIVCDPACGSGGFLIRYFQKVQDGILKSLDADYQKKKAEVKQNKKLKAKEKSEKILKLFNDYEKSADIFIKDTRLWNLANKCIFGADANERMARTSKMNMIMHGDGHGGIKHQNGFINKYEIQDEHFDYIFTNPPFGSVVNDKIILSEYELPQGKSIKEEFLFIERCLNLLKPQGKLAIVLPESVYNNPSDVGVREFAEDRANILAVVSLPLEAFYQSGASIKCSLLFVQKKTEKEVALWKQAIKNYQEEVFKTQTAERKIISETLDQKISIKDFETKEAYQKVADELKETKKEAQRKLRELDRFVIEEGRRKAKHKIDYNIFIAETELVGYTTTGDPTTNQLTEVLKDFHKFSSDKKLTAPTFPNAKSVSYSQTKRWDVKSFFEKESSWNSELVKTVSYFGSQFKKQVSKEDVIKNKYRIIKKINFGGELFLRAFEEVNTYKGNMFLVPAGSFIFSKINARHGCFYYHEKNEKPFVVSNEYPVIVFDEKKVFGEFVQLALRFGIAKQQLNSKAAGMAKPRVNIQEFLKITIPVPELTKQKEIVKSWIDAKELEKQAKQKKEIAIKEITKYILGEEK